MTTIEEEAVEKIVLRVPVEMLEELRKAADASDMPVKDYILRLIDQDIKRRKPGIAPEKIAEMLKENEAPEALVKKLGLEQVSDAGELGKLVDEVIAANPQSIADFKAGKKKALGFLVGQIMKATHGKANPGMVNKMLMEKLQ